MCGRKKDWEWGRQRERETACDTIKQCKTRRHVQYQANKSSHTNQRNIIWHCKIFEGLFYPPLPPILSLRVLFHQSWVFYLLLTLYLVTAKLKLTGTRLFFLKCQKQVQELSPGYNITATSPHPHRFLHLCLLCACMVCKDSEYNK